MRASDDPWRVRERDFPAGGTMAERLAFLLNYAVLAPSSHNTQPWLFRVHADAIDLLADRRRGLPVVDPHDRELVISCGAALEFLATSVRYFGHEADVKPFPEAAARDLLARVQCGARADPDPDTKSRFAAIPERRTTRLPFAPDPVDAVTVERIRALASAHGVGLNFISNPDQCRTIAALVARGDRVQFADRRFRRELALWIHSRRGRKRDGISAAGFGMPDVLSPAGAFVVRTFDLGDRVATRDADIAAGSPLLGLLHTTTDTPDDWLRTGRALAGVVLGATAAGVRSSYLNQPIEVESLRPELAAAAGLESFPQLLLRFGHGPLVKPAVRRPLREVVVG